MRILSHILVLSGLLGLMACNPLSGGSGSTVANNFLPGLPSGQFPDHVELVSGNNQTGIAGYPVSITLGLVDINGAPVPNITMTTTVLTGGGSTSSSVTSNANGLITVTWTLGTSAGIQTMQISGSGFSGSPSSMVLTAVATAGNVSAANSTITGTSPVTADGSSQSVITITLQDSSGNPVSGLTPSFSATDTGTTNVYGTCSTGNASGVSTCTLSSEKAETKVLSIATPVVETGGSVVFQAGTATKLAFTASPASASAGATLSTSTVEALDPYNNLDTTFTGSVAVALGSNPGSGTLSGTLSETASGGIVSFPGLSINKEGTGYTLVASYGGLTSATSSSFDINPASASNISISSGNSQSGTVGAALGSSFTVLVTDSSGNPVPSATVDWAVASGGGSLASASSITGSTGLATNTLTLGNTAGTNTVTATIDGTSTAVTFTATGTANSTIASIAWVTAPAASYTASNSSAMTTFTAELLDSHGNLISGNSSTTVTLSLASGTGTLGGTLTQQASGGIATFSNITYTKAQSITITATENTNHNTVNSSSITVSPNSPSTSTSSISSSATSVNDDGTTATITITLLDAYSNPVPSQSVAFAATGSGNTLVQPSSNTNSSGQATGTIASSVTGTKTLSISTPSGFTGVTTTVTFVSTSVSATNSTITGTSSVVANGSSTSSITITLLDSNSNGVSGVTPTFSATGSGNSYGVCSSSNGSGVSTCTMTSTKAETKTLSITGPVSKSGGTVTFINGAASQLVFSTQPTGGVAQTVTLPTQPVIYIEDANGNLVTTAPDATASVTLSLSSGTGSLTGTLTQAASGGIATFSGIAVDTQGTGKVITATKASTSPSGTGSISQTSNSFTINPPAPGSFTITSATANAGGTISVAWGASTNASSYTVTYGTTSGGPYGNTASTSATSPYTVTGLTNTTTYYFMVTAVNVTGSTNGSPQVSAESDSTPPTTPGTPTWASSYSTSSASTPQLSWSASSDVISGISYYQVALGTSAGDTSVVGWTNIGNVTSYTFTGLSLANSTAYYATVRAVDGSGNTSTAANSGAFTVDTTAPTAPGTPTWGASYSASTSSTPALSWTASTDGISGISYYQVALGTTSGGTDVVGWTSAGNVTSYTFSGLSLSNGTSYYASVQAVDTAGNTSTVAKSGAFTVDTSPPTTPGSPSWASAYGGYTTSTPTLSWTASTDSGSGLSYYQVALGTSAGATNVVAWTSVGNVTSYSFSSLTLTNGSSYYATVRAVDAVGNISTAANTTSLTIDTAAPSPPTSVTNAYTTTSTTAAPALSWTASASASATDFSGYQVAIGTTQGGSDILTWTSVGNVTSYTPSTGFTLIDGTAYYPSVRAIKSTNLTSTTANGNEFAVVTDTATLSFNFLTGSTPLTSTNTNYPAMVQFSRASGTNVSPGTYYNSSGVITTAPENYLKESQDIISPWGEQDVPTITTAATTAPDGTTTGNLLQESLDSSNEEHYIQQNLSGTPTNTTYTYSVYVKSYSGDRWVELLFFDGSATSNYVRGIFQYSAGAFSFSTYQVGTTSIYISNSVTAVGNGWYRLSITGQPSTNSNTATLARVRINGGSNSAIVYTGNGTSGFYVWGAQFEQNTSPSSYIYTTTAAAYGPRFDYNPATLSLNGLLAEQSSTNKLTNSGTPANWSLQSGATGSASTVTAPDGSTNAYTFTDSSSTQNSYVAEGATVPNDSTSWTCSAYLMQGTAAQTGLGTNIYGGTSTSAQAIVTWGTTPTVTNGTITSVGNGWYRVSATQANNSSGNTTAACYIYPASWVSGGSTTGSVIAWGMQLENLTVPTSYIPTTTAAMTRQADIATLSTSVGSWFSATQGTLVASGISLYGATGGNNRIASLDDTTISNEMILYLNSGGTSGYLAQEIKTSGTAYLNTNSSDFALTSNTAFITALGYQANNFSGAANGSIGTATSGSVPTVTELSIGSTAGSSNFDGWIQSVQYYNSKLSNSAIQFLSK